MGRRTKIADFPPVATGFLPLAIFPKSSPGLDTAQTVAFAAKIATLQQSQVGTRSDFPAGEIRFAALAKTAEKPKSALYQ